MNRQTSLTLSLTLVSSCVLASALAKTLDYDPVEARKKLKQIGRALQLYRQEYGMKPVEQWQEPSDAGLPPNLLYLSIPGHKWSLPDGRGTFKLQSLNDHLPHSASDFANLYLMPGIELKSGDPYENFGETMRSRGERLPIMADYNFDSDDQHKKLLPKRFALVLRLNGKVDAVEYETGPMDIFRR